MKLTTEVLKAFIGGQVEVQNSRDGYLFRGQIAEAVVQDDDMILTLAWLAKGEGYPPIPTHWTKDPRKEYAASLSIYHIQDIGPGSEGSTRLCLTSIITGEITVLFPPDGSKIAEPV